MRQIVKRQPPSNVAVHPPPRSWGQASAELKVELGKPTTNPVALARSAFDALNKEVIRLALGAEQSSLCVFCERAVRPEAGPVEEPTMGVRIAHWKPVSRDPAGALDWHNVYASCTGTWESGAKTCDEQQGEADPGIQVPSTRDWGTQLEFGSTGDVKVRPGAPPALATAIGPGVWNLNHPSLVSAREAAIRMTLKLARRDRDSKPYPPKNAVIQKHLQRLSDSPLPFVTAVRQSLNRWRT